MSKLPIVRMAWVSTHHTGGSLDVPGPEGLLQARRVDPDGVIVMVNDQKISIRKEDLPAIGRYFLAAGLMLGQDPNEGWDAGQDGAKPNV